MAENGILRFYIGVLHGSKTTRYSHTQKCNLSLNMGVCDLQPGVCDSLGNRNPPMTIYGMGVCALLGNYKWGFAIYCHTGMNILTQVLHASTGLEIKVVYTIADHVLFILN